MCGLTASDPQDNYSGESLFFQGPITPPREHSRCVTFIVHPAKVYVGGKPCFACNNARLTGFIGHEDKSLVIANTLIEKYRPANDSEALGSLNHLCMLALNHVTNILVKHWPFKL